MFRSQDLQMLRYCAPDQYRYCNPAFDRSNLTGET